MKKLLLILPILLTSVSCKYIDKTNIKIDNQFINSFHYPIDSLATPRVFVYQRADKPDLHYSICQKRIIIDKDTTLIAVRIGINGLIDSSAYLYKNKGLILKEQFRVLTSRQTNTKNLIKGEDLKYYDKGYEKNRYLKFVCPNDLYTNIVENIYSKYDNQTIYRIFGKDIECVQFNDSVFSFIGASNPVELSKIEIKGKSILAKNIGLVQIEMQVKGSENKVIWKLEKIVDFKTYQKEYSK